jgi:hypothetical protein
MAREDWQATLDAMREMKMVDSVRPVGEYYTNDFVPSD